MSAARPKVGILGASGYGGAALIERLVRHPEVELVALGSRQYVGQDLSSCWPQFAGLLPELRFVESDEAIEASEVLFCATPHAATAPLVKQALDAGKRVIDLSADFRLDMPTYREWYGQDHPHPELWQQAVYGLVELHRGELPGAPLVASPGCNATAASLALAPLVAAGLVGSSVVVNVITGVSGAGRAVSQALQFSEASQNARAYKPSGTHRHTAEIEATAGRVRAAVKAGEDGKLLSTHTLFEPLKVSFTPHLVPMDRGILATVTTQLPADAKLGSDELVRLVADYYQGDPLVRVSPELPQVKAVRGSDRAILSAAVDERTDHALVFCAIDNLGKGAAGQAVQGFNIAFGFPETSGLSSSGLWP